jgi:Putative prokaryotic signal transducing protein
MRLLYSSLKLLEVHHLKNLLEVEGIRCQIKNELLSQLAGDIPFTECAPELWLLDDRDFDRARRIVSDLGRAPRASPPWQCSGCGETLEGQFSACWRCGAPRPQI